MDPTNANTALASAFVEELARGGLRRAVVSPGSRSTPLAIALWREPAIEMAVILDERSAAFFALGAAQASGEPVALACTSGTAAANYLPAVCEADESALPLLVLTSDRPPELRGVGAGQTIDQIGLYGSAVRWFCEVGTHAADDQGLLHLRGVACRALALARGELRPGPVHLNLSWREPLAPLPVAGAVSATDPLALAGREEAPLTAVRRVERAPTAATIDRLARRIGEAGDPGTGAPQTADPGPGGSAGAGAGVIVAGRQLDPALRAPLAALAAATGFPILAEPTSQLRCGPHDRSHVVAAYDLLLRDERFAAAVRPDLVLRFGELPTSKPLRAWLAASGAEQIVVDPDGGWNEPSRRAAALLRDDPVALASGLAARLAGTGADPSVTPTSGGKAESANLWLAAEQAAQAAIDATLGAEPELGEPALQRALGEAHRDGDLVYTASSMPIRDQESFLATGPTDALFLCNRGANGIDGLISSGIGAAAASGRPTTIVSGDLGLLHDLGGLAALREVSTPVRILVIDNDGGGIFHFLPQQQALGGEEFEALFGTPRGVDVARAAALFDLPHTRLTDLADLPAALAAGTGLIELKTDRQANVEAHRRISAAVAAAIPG